MLHVLPTNDMANDYADAAFTTLPSVRLRWPSPAAIEQRRRSCDTCRIGLAVLRDTGEHLDR